MHIYAKQGSFFKERLLARKDLFPEWYCQKLGDSEREVLGDLLGELLKNIDISNHFVYNPNMQEKSLYFVVYEIFRTLSLFSEIVMSEIATTNEKNEDEEDDDDDDVGKVGRRITIIRTAIRGTPARLSRRARWECAWK